MKKALFFDVTLPMTSELIVYPGDPKIKIKKLNTIEKHGFCLQQMTLHNHMGTHIDFPGHVFKHGKTSEDYPLFYFCGKGIVIEVPAHMKSITKAFVESFSKQIMKNDIVLFKTSNSALYQKKKPSKQYVYFEKDAAKVLAKKHPKMIGIDYLSPDRYGDTALPIHQIFLSQNILILEGLFLRDVPEGRYREILAIPVCMPCMDGLPASVFLRP